jgi:hypothetical protein
MTLMSCLLRLFGGQAITYLGVFHQRLVNVSAAVLNKLIVGCEDDKSYFTIAQNAELIGFLHQAVFALQKGHLLSI